MTKTQNRRSQPRNRIRPAAAAPAPQRRGKGKPNSHPQRFARAIAIAARYRHLVPRGRSVLFHGTKHPRSIIREDGLVPRVPWEYPVISFTRSLHVAVHFAMLQQDDEEATGAVVMLDRELLRHNYKLEPYHDPMVSDLLEWDERSAAEAEERVVAMAIPNLKKYLLGTIWLREDERFYQGRRKRSGHRPAYKASDVQSNSSCRKRLRAAASLQRLFRFRRFGKTLLARCKCKKVAA